MKSEQLSAAYETCRSLEIIAWICLSASVIYLVFSIFFFPYRDIAELFTRERWILQEFISYPLLRLNITRSLFYLVIACVPYMICACFAKVQQHKLPPLVKSAPFCIGLAGLVTGFTLTFIDWWSGYPHLFR